MQQGFLRLLVPVSMTSTVDQLATQAVNNAMVELVKQIGSFTVQTCGLYRSTTHYRFDVIITNEVFHQPVTVDVHKASIEKNSLQILDNMPYLKL